LLIFIDLLVKKNSEQEIVGGWEEGRGAITKIPEFPGCLKMAHFERGLKKAPFYFVEILKEDQFSDGDYGNLVKQKYMETIRF